MMPSIQLRCDCAAIQGHIQDAVSTRVNRMWCYCDDCQAFLHHLGRAELLDAHGGSDVVQLAPQTLRFERGTDQIVGLRLKPQGLYRWYANCCKTPLGNTLSPSLPFVGVLTRALLNGTPDLDAAVGKPVATVMGKFARGTPPPGSTQFNLGLLLRAVRLIFGWKFTGKTWPHPFFDRNTRAPIYPVTVLSPAEREALRPLCGPATQAAP